MIVISLFQLKDNKMAGGQRLEHQRFKTPHMSVNMWVNEEPSLPQQLLNVLLSKNSGKVQRETTDTEYVSATRALL